ncbi:RNA polymerase sigma-70 factor [Streptomyces sp. RKND-216]|uniref:RNA polymerase sigma-70 factor n=1 Tax=Streptomyces sp. RKND-216 TaxID=2562581 RepID=UPI001FF8A053|nr:RNA polymerase sigma-70 factor [Streptomyces sp. RKND-216]
MAAENSTTAPAREFQQHRDVLLAVAYRMLGRVADAEDVVQEAWLRWSAADTTAVRDARGYLVRTTTRLAIDRLRQVQARKETYVGPWLPEPFPTDLASAPVPDGADRVVLAESVSLALLVVLESLSPLERAVFVLREAFGYPYTEIAATLERAEPAVRQLAGRARRHVAERRPRFEVDPAQQRDLTERFLAAATAGDLEGLLAVLAPDAHLVGDAGGKAKAPRRVIESARKVARFLAAIGPKEIPDVRWTFLELNGAPAVLVTSGGRPHTVMSVDVIDGRIRTLYLMANPDKVAHLAP